MLRIAILLALALVQAPPPQNGIIQQWSGRITRSAAVLAPAKGYISNAGELSALWQAWAIKADMPAVDFQKLLVVVNTSRSSVFKVVQIQVDEAGEMKTVLIATPDIRPDVAYVITVTERRGAKTLHGIPIE